MPTTPTMPTPRTAVVRTHAGFELPAAGTWTIDPTHADVSFVGRHFMLTKVRGRFTALSGAIDIADDPAQSRLDVTIDMASVASGDPGRDDHLRSAELFDVERFPTASYRSTAVEWQGSAGQVTGELTIKGISRPVTLSVEYVGHAADPWGNERAVFSAWAVIDREHWGITWNAVLETGGLLVSKEIRLEIEVEAILQP